MCVKEDYKEMQVFQGNVASRPTLHQASYNINLASESGLLGSTSLAEWSGMKSFGFVGFLNGADCRAGDTICEIAAREWEPGRRDTASLRGGMAWSIAISILRKRCRVGRGVGLQAEKWGNDFTIGRCKYASDRKR